MNDRSVQFEASYGTSSQLPPSDLPEIAFAGRSNVGKSSMINKLFNRKKLARVSRGAGQDRHHQLFPRRSGIRFVGPARLRLRQGLEGGKAPLGGADRRVLCPGPASCGWSSSWSICAIRPRRTT